MDNRFFVILLGTLIMLTAFVTASAISSSQKNQVAGISKTSEPSTSSTSLGSPPSPQNDFSYPNASVVSSSQSQLHLDSTDNPKVVTDWYKQKLSGLGYPITNFVATSNNDNIENKLQSVGPKKISVEISRGHGESLTEIKVNLE